MDQIRVLLADDHMALRNNIRRLLSRSADIAVVGEAADGAETLRMVEELQPDVLLLDMEMPLLTGPEVARKLRSENSPVLILALSAYDDREYIQAMMSYGASGYLIKDEAPRRLVDAIRAVASGVKLWSDA